MERLFVVSFPLRVASLLTRKAAIIVIAVETVISFTAGSYVSVTFELVFGNSHCLTHGKLYKTYNTINLVIAKGIGEVFCSVLVAVFPGIIIYKLLAAKEWRETQEGSKSTKETSITVMLVIVAIAFVALRAPYTVAYYLLHYRSNIFSAESLKTATENLNIATNIGYALIVMNYSLNFFLYR